MRKSKREADIGINLRCHGVSLFVRISPLIHLPFSLQQAQSPLKQSLV